MSDDDKNTDDRWDHDERRKEDKYHRSFRRRVINTVTFMILILIAGIIYFYCTLPDPFNTFIVLLRGGFIGLDAFDILPDTNGGIITTNVAKPSTVTPPGGEGDARPKTGGGHWNDHPYPFLIGDKQQFIPIPDLEECVISFQPPAARTEESDWRLPLWVPSYPSSGASNPTNKGDMVREMIGLLTGLPRKPVKNYHMSIRGKLKRCKGMSETVACTQGHPLIDIKPHEQTQNFQPHVIMPIRNFATAFPASLTDKNIAYHQGTKQTTIDEWRSTRDEHMKGSFESWKTMILWWKQAEYYQIALYLPFEDVFWRENGSGAEIVKELSDVLRTKGGFESTNSHDDLKCIWYRIYKDEWHRQQSIMEYIPPYTQEQQQWMMDEMKKFQSHDQVSDDPELVALLDRYIAQIAQFTPLDGQ